MDRSKLLAAAMALPADERVALVADIWDSLAASPEPVRLTAAQERELELAYQEYLANPKAGAEWEVVRARMAR